MASEYCWMEPANGCRICMRILSGERARLPGFGLTEGSLVATCGALRLHLDILQLGNGTQNYRDSDGIDRYPGASGPRLHIGFRRRCTMASIQPGLNLRKATFYEGENCGGLHHAVFPVQQIAQAHLSQIMAALLVMSSLRQMVALIGAGHVGIEVRRVVGQYAAARSEEH